MNVIGNNLSSPIEVIKGRISESTPAEGNNNQQAAETDQVVLGGDQSAKEPSRMNMRSVAMGKNFAVDFKDADNLKNLKVKLVKDDNNEVSALVENPNDKQDPKSSSVVSVKLGKVEEADDKYFKDDFFMAAINPKAQSQEEKDPIASVAIIKNDREKATSILINDMAYMMTIQNGKIEGSNHPFSF